MRLRLATLLFVLLCAPGWPADWYCAAAGDDTTGDGSVGTPYRNPAKALSVASAGDNIYCKNDGTYTAQDGANDCILYMDVAMTTKSTPTVIAGYQTTPGSVSAADLTDFDPSSLGLMYGVRTDGSTGARYVTFKNIKVTGGADINWLLTGEDGLEFINCQSIDSGADGWEVDNDARFFSCHTSNSAKYSWDTDSDAYFLDCSLSGGTRGIYGLGGLQVVGCTFYAFSDAAITSNLSDNLVMYCTIDGRDGGSTVGIDVEDDLNSIILNNIIRDCNIGIRADASTPGALYEDYNCIYSCTTARTNVETGPNSITSDPQHTTPGSAVYTLQSGSPCIDTGLGNSTNMGSFEYTAAGGGGGAVQLVGGGLVQ